MNKTAPERPALPFDIDIEQALLGAVLIDELAIAKVEATLVADDFYDPMHQRLWSAIAEKHGRREQVTPLTLTSAMGDDEGFKEVGARDYLVSLARAAPALPNVEEYARILKDLAARRYLMGAAEALLQDCMTAPIEVSVQQILNQHAVRLQAVEDHQPQIDCVNLPDAFDHVMVQAERALNGEKPPAIYTGIAALDEALGGFQGGDMVIIAGRPGMGKTVVLTSICRNTVKQDVPACLFELEMSRDPILHRFLCDEDFDYSAPQKPLLYWNFRRGRLSEPEFERAYSAQRRLRLAPLHLFDASSMTMQQIGARAERIVAKSKRMGVICVDYLQIVDPGDRYVGQKVAEVSAISTGAKRLAKRLGWPVVLGCQLSRETEKRSKGDKRPTLGDLRESGQIEQDADIVIGCYREEYYLERSEPAAHTSAHVDWLADMERAKNKLELLVLKNRQGPTPSVECFVDIGASAVRNSGYKRVSPHAGAGQELLPVFQRG